MLEMRSVLSFNARFEVWWSMHTNSLNCTELPMQKSEPLNTPIQNLVPCCPHNSQMKCTIKSWSPPIPQVGDSRAELQRMRGTYPKQCLPTPTQFCTSFQNKQFHVQSQSLWRNGKELSVIHGLCNFTTIILGPYRNMSGTATTNMKQSSRDKTHLPVFED